MYTSAPAAIHNRETGPDLSAVKARQQGAWSAVIDSNLQHALTSLAKGKLMRVRDGLGRGVAVFAGLVWITQDGDPRDYLIGAGETYAFDRPGLAIVEALENTRLLVFETQTEGDLISYEAAWWSSTQTRSL